MVNIVIGTLCILLALIIIGMKGDDPDDSRFVIFNLIIGVINLFIGCIGIICFNTTYIITINKNDGTSIEVETQNYDIDDGYVKIEQDDSNIYIYNVKDVTVKKKDK